MRYTLSILMQELDFLKDELQAIKQKIEKFDFETITEYEFYKSKEQEISVLIEIINTDILVIYNFSNDKKFNYNLNKFKNEN